eukprot:767498-Hanusia_phi.AAC.1
MRKSPARACDRVAAARRPSLPVAGQAEAKDEERREDEECTRYNVCPVVSEREKERRGSASTGRGQRGETLQGSEDTGARDIRRQDQVTLLPRVLISSSNSLSLGHPPLSSKDRREG